MDEDERASIFHRMVRAVMTLKNRQASRGGGQEVNEISNRTDASHYSAFLRSRQDCRTGIHHRVAKHGVTSPMHGRRYARHGWVIPIESDAQGTNTVRDNANTRRWSAPPTFFATPSAGGGNHVTPRQRCS